MVVNWAWPLSSTFTPVGAPMGRSGFFSSVLASVVSAHFFSDSDGWRSSKTSWIGDSATGGLFLFSAIGIAANPHDKGCRKDPARREYLRVQVRDVLPGTST